MVFFCHLLPLLYLRASYLFAAVPLLPQIWLTSGWASIEYETMNWTHDKCLFCRLVSVMQCSLPFPSLIVRPPPPFSGSIVSLSAVPYSESSPSCLVRWFCESGQIGHNALIWTPVWCVLHSISSSFFILKLQDFIFTHYEKAFFSLSILFTSDTIGIVCFLADTLNTLA